MILKIFLVTFLFSGIFAERWRYSWSCKDDKCVRTRTEFSLKNVEYDDVPQFDTLSICRLTCGQYGALWPAPTNTTDFGNKSFKPFHPSSIQYIFPTAQGEALVYLSNVKDIFNKTLMRECGRNCIEDKSTSIDIYAESLDINNVVDLLPDTDESYEVRIRNNENKITVSIKAANIFGLRHGFETLSQLTATYKVPGCNGTKSKNGLVILTEAHIVDKPVYIYRGLLIDSARNWLSLNAIKKQIDGMAASKMNVLHWHATDSQSFPLILPSEPRMARYGAYSTRETYSIEDIEEIRDYAKFRGVRILLELDAPSHAGFGWQWGEKDNMGNLSVCVNQQPWRQYCIQPPCGQLNPANQNIYSVLEKLYGDMRKVIGGKEWFHMGGDEVFFPCWNATEEIIKYMQSKGLGQTLPDFLELWGEFQSKALAAFDKVTSEKVPIMLWTSHLTNPDVIEKYLPKDRYIIETWVPEEDPLPTQLLSKGYKLVISTKDSWYLDHGFNGITQYHNWRKVYNNKLPYDNNVLGGEVCMWGENVDGAQIDAKVWPRAAAAAERLWSNTKLKDGDAEARMYRHRERLVARGIHAEALAPEWCLQNERQCS